MPARPRVPLLILLACAGLLTGVPAPGAADAPAEAPTRVPPTDARFAYMGRLDVSPDRARMGFPGVTVRFAFRGPAPSIRMTGDSPNCYFNLSCNGWDPVLIHLKQGPNEIALPTGAM